jgi:hypothetical protein
MTAPNFAKYLLIAVLFTITALWLGLVPITLLGIGFSGGEVLSLPGLYEDLAAGDLNWRYRALAWFTVSWPIILTASVVRLRRRY